MKKKVLILIFIFLGGFFLTRNDVYSQGNFSCFGGVLDQPCDTYSSNCEEGYVPAFECSDYNAPNCPTLTDCILLGTTPTTAPQPTPTSGPPPCGNIEEPCCGTIPPLTCNWPYVPSNESTPDSCVCEEALTPPPPLPTLPPISLPPSQPGVGYIDTAIGRIDVSSPEAFVNKILTFSLGIGGGIAIILIIIGGGQVLTSAGNPEKVKAGKELITSAVSGLLLIVFAVFLLKLIGKDILKIFP